MDAFKKLDELILEFDVANLSTNYPAFYDTVMIWLKEKSNIIKDKERQIDIATKTIAQLVVDKSRLKTELQNKIDSIKYLEQFIKFCPECHNPQDDCMCDRIGK